MASLKKEKEQETEKALEPYRCYACLKYDGTIGPEENMHTYLCARCKDIPDDQGPILAHMDQENAMLAEINAGAAMLTCRRCNLERDECVCRDNPLIQRERQLDDAPQEDIFDDEIIFEDEDGDPPVPDTDPF